MTLRRIALLTALFALAGCGTPSLLITPVAGSSELEEVTLSSSGGWNPGKVVIVPIEGLLASGSAGGLLPGGENPMSNFQQEIDKIAGDSSVKAIVLRVDSPGGTVSSSDAMYTILKRYKAHTGVPIVASVSEVCASGAYYVSCASNQIVVQPTSIVGSIGVIFNTFDASGTLAKIGVKAEPIKSGPNKDIGSFFKPLSDSDRKIMQDLVDQYFAWFKSIVKENRPLHDDAEFVTLTDGRVFSGTDAVKLGLADRTGLLIDAISLAKRLGDAPHAKVVTYRKAYAAGGSIYATSQAPTPQANTMQLQLPGEHAIVPTGFYYLWQP